MGLGIFRFASPECGVGCLAFKAMILSPAYIYTPHLLAQAWMGIGRPKSIGVTKSRDQQLLSSLFCSSKRLM